MGIRAVCYPVHRFECAALEYTLSNHPPPRPSYPPLVATQMKLRPRSSISRCAYLRVKRRFSSIHFCPITPPPPPSLRRVAFSLSLRFLLTLRWLWFFCNLSSYRHICADDGSCRSRYHRATNALSIVQPFWWRDAMKISNMVYGL